MKKTTSKNERIWDNFVPLGEIPCSAKQKIVFQLAAREGVRYVNVRKFYYKTKAKEWRPSTTGLAISLRIPVNRGTQVLEVLPKVITMLQHALEELPNLELYNEDNAVWHKPKESEDIVDENSN